jgi:hypothetical protein
MCQISALQSSLRAATYCFCSVASWSRKEHAAESLMAAVKRFENLPVPISPLVCRRNAEKFAAERFRQEFDALVQLRWAEFQASLGSGFNAGCGEQSNV